MKAGHYNPISSDSSTSGNRENGGSTRINGNSGVDSSSSRAGSGTGSDSGIGSASGSDSRSQSIPSHRQWSEVLDWLVMSEAKVAMMTSDSTFAQTARYRAGTIHKDSYRVEIPS